MEDPLEKYQKLGIRESLSRICQYPLACKELSFILMNAYLKVPKNLQSLIFQDTLIAFRLLPGVQTQTAVAAANLLLQRAEASLPKQKKVLAVTEFKHAVVIHKRRSKAKQKVEVSAELPQDVLVHLFQFLDLRSLISAALTCRSWNAAASDDDLWNLQYTTFFSNSNGSSKIKVVWSGGSVKHKEFGCLEKDGIDKAAIDWREAFKRAYKGISSKKLSATRGICRHCDTFVWLNELNSTREHFQLGCKYHEIKPVSTQQIVGYILGDSVLWPSFSDSDSDSDEGSMSKLWAYSKHIRNLSL